MPRLAVTDWAGNYRAYSIAWGVPSIAIIAGAFLDEQLRTIIWSIALLWMGSACLVNASRCGRTHCRYTGPFYLFLIIPVLLHGSGWFSLGLYGWWILGITILPGGKFIWWASEAAWGSHRPLRRGRGS